MHFKAKRIFVDDPLLKEQFDFLGWDDATLINKGPLQFCGCAAVYLEKKWVLEEDDKDMIVMLHEIEYEVKRSRQTRDQKLKVELVVKGEE
jgi:hypothetical protein